ncbi:MAG: hypothetical protein ACK5Q5_03410 [Planctomycetaceae bacterium]
MTKHFGFEGLERLPSGWFVEVNSERLGGLPLEPRPLPQFRLAATGEGRFAELYLQPLEPGPSR